MVPPDSVLDSRVLQSLPLFTQGVGLVPAASWVVVVLIKPTP